VMELSKCRRELTKTDRAEKEGRESARVLSRVGEQRENEELTLNDLVLIVVSYYGSVVFQRSKVVRRGTWAKAKATGGREEVSSAGNGEGRGPAGRKRADSPPSERMSPTAVRWSTKGSCRELVVNV